jgi:hypothetical protein
VISSLHLLHLAGCSLTGCSLASGRGSSGRLFLVCGEIACVGKSIDDLCGKEKAKVLAAAGEGSWRGVGRWNTQTASRVGEGLAGLEVMNSLAT